MKENAVLVHARGGRAVEAAEGDQPSYFFLTSTRAATFTLNGG
jgi:hypothetical protein